MNSPEQSQLGKPVAYADHYDPCLLFPIARAAKRDEIGIAGAPPFFGADLWTAFELSWLNPRGKPQVARGMVAGAGELLPRHEPAGMLQAGREQVALCMDAWAAMFRGYRAGAVDYLDRTMTYMGGYEHVPFEEAIIYRNFIEGAGTRAIGVGYPEKLNLAFDANEMRLATSGGAR